MRGRGKGRGRQDAMLPTPPDPTREVAAGAGGREGGGRTGLGRLGCGDEGKVKGHEGLGV